MGDAQNEHTDFMKQALGLAARGAGAVAPNPMVGCVLVKDGLVIAEGWHKGAGRAHAEIEALENAGDKAPGATAYVTLEPCNHHGRTGPCAEALIKAGVANVVYAMDDPNPVATGGAERLKAAGISVAGGVCEKAARFLNRAWLHWLNEKRPYVIGKSAMSMDGRIATQFGESKWITSEESRKTAHHIRAAVDAIIVGAGTVIADDPALTARVKDKTHYPLRIVLDSAARTSPGAKVFERSGKGAVLAATKAAPTDRLAAFEEMGVEPLLLPAYANGRADLEALLAILSERDIVTVMIEGGGEVLGSFFDAGLIDELELFIAPTIIGGGKPAFGGLGVEQLAQTAQFDFQQLSMEGPDQHWRGLRRKEAP